eukprot:CFRG1159T1
MKLCNRGPGMDAVETTALQAILSRLNKEYTQFLPCIVPVSIALVLQNSVVLASSDFSSASSTLPIATDEVMSQVYYIVRSGRAFAQSQRKTNDPNQEIQGIHLEGSMYMFSIFQLQDSTSMHVVVITKCTCARPVIDIQTITASLSEKLEEVKQSIGSTYLDSDLISH